MWLNTAFSDFDIPLDDLRYAAVGVLAAESERASKLVDADKSHPEEKRAVLTGLAVAGTVLNGLAGFIKGINGPDNVKDVSVMSPR